MFFKLTDTKFGRGREAASEDGEEEAAVTSLPIAHVMS